MTNLEKIEKEALKSLHEHCPNETKAILGLGLSEVGDALVATSTKDPSILLNRTLGLGVQTTVATKSLKEIADEYETFRISKYFLHLYESELPDEVRSALPEIGLRKTRGWMKFQRDLSPPVDSPATLTVKKVGCDGANDFGRIVCNAFGLTEAAIPLLAGLASDPRWHLYVSYEGDSAAGAGALFISGDYAWLEWGATNPEYRRRGSQAAIMSARIAKARELGCKHIFTETGESVEEDPQHSYKNILKHGFVEEKLRANYEPENT